MAETGDIMDAVLGEEFLTWLWYQSDTAPGAFRDAQGQPFQAYMEQRIVVESGQGENRETATVAGSLSPLREARFGLGTGKKVARAVIRIEQDPLSWQCSIKASDFSINSLKTPKVDRTDADDDPDALALEKIFLIESFLKLLDSLYRQFLDLRISSQWANTVAEMGAWLGRTE